MTGTDMPLTNATECIQTTTAEKEQNAGDQRAKETRLAGKINRLRPQGSNPGCSNDHFFIALVLTGNREISICIEPQLTMRVTVRAKSNRHPAISGLLVQ